MQPWGEAGGGGAGEGAEKQALGVGGASKRRAAAVVTAKRGEGAVDEADGRREACW